MGYEVRGGYPHVFRETIDTTGRAHVFGRANNTRFISKFIQFRVSGNPLRVYFTEADYTADENYILVPVSPPNTSNVGWEGPLEVNQVWLKAVGGDSALELVAYQRRG